MRPIHEYTQVSRLAFPAVHADVHLTPEGIPYLREPGVVLIGQTAAQLTGLAAFLGGLDPTFPSYLDDPTSLDSGSLLAKFAGQVCYLSLGEKRSKHADADKYFENIKAQKHGSVLEHPVYTFLLYGIDRAVTHELVRHRAGTAFSQVSQRYVGPEMVRYVMPIEMQGDPEAEALFFDDVATNLGRYKRRIDLFERKMLTVTGETRTEKRKRMQSFARRALANEVEAPIVVTGNARTWRHVLTKRCAPAADRAIRTPFFEVSRILRAVNATAFADFAETQLPDGSRGLTPAHDSV